MSWHVHQPGHHVNAGPIWAECEVQIWVPSWFVHRSMVAPPVFANMGFKYGQTQVGPTWYIPMDKPTSFIDVTCTHVDMLARKYLIRQRFRTRHQSHFSLTTGEALRKEKLSSYIICPVWTVGCDEYCSLRALSSSFKRLK